MPSACSHWKNKVTTKSCLEKCTDDQINRNQRIGNMGKLLHMPCVPQQSDSKVRLCGPSLCLVCLFFKNSKYNNV